MKKIHLIGNAHLDPVWLWRWQEGMAEVKATFRSALDRINEFPDFVFTCAGGSYYKWVEENAPDMFDEIRQRVREGRWVPAGGWWIQPDCNLPCGESFIRHGLIGQRYVLERFGKICDVGYNVDSFGHDGMLPQILKKSGLKNYVFMRPDQDENSDIPPLLFSWESPDGTAVTAWRIPVSYSDYIGTVRNCYKEKLLMAADRAEEFDTDLMEFYGVGNHGGGPTVRTINTLKETAKTISSRVQIRFSSPSEFFKNLKDKPTGQWNKSIRHHSPGCYSVHTGIKKGNRCGENALLSAEKYSALSGWLTGHEFPAEQLQNAWEGLLFNQFHDILGGCSIESACKDTAAAHGKTLAVASEEENQALQKISWQINTWWTDRPQGKDKHWRVWEQDDAGVPVVVFNSHSWEFRGTVSVQTQATRIEDESGRVVGHQTIRSECNNREERHAALFPVVLPPLGYRVYRLYTTKQGAESQNSLRITEHSIENDYLSLKFNAQSGALVSLKNKETGTELIAGAAAQAVVCDDLENDTWGHGQRSFNKTEGHFSGAQFLITESGPVRASLRVKTVYHHSWLIQDFFLEHDARHVTVRARVLWNEPYKMLKIAFPLMLRDPEYISSLTFGFEQNPADGHENTGQKWVAVRGETPSGGSAALAIANDGLPAHSCADSELRISILRSPEYADLEGIKDGFIPNIDIGAQTFSYSLIPMERPDFVRIHRRAEELNTPPFVITETYHKGPLDLSQSGIRISEDSIAASAVKRSYDQDGWIVRCHELRGASIRARIELPLLNMQFESEFGPFEIKTFCIPDGQRAVREVSLIEMENMKEDPS